MKKEIKEIILNKKITITDKLVSIYKLIDSDYSELAKVLGIETIVLENWAVIEIKKDKEKKDKSMITQYLEMFDVFHNKVHGRKYDWNKKDFGQLKFCVKKFVNLETWRHILILVEQANIRLNKKMTCNFSWKYIIESMSPGIIYSKRNFILNELEKKDKILQGKAQIKKEWNW